ncbi:phytase [Exilibacterium tricleocarpae]|uniref:Phytase n=1 Tax=Exilibacterium tricleocarpae TaxID=2591008 RepID=A0A545TNF7_9GAMM|nr:phytase [Exilibacterium tricleocarpae]TQV78755.1 phytase [Exilibacterium tricleocarpae]
MNCPQNPRFYVYANDKDGRIVQYLLYENDAREVAARVVRRLAVASQPEGCVVDDLTGRLFIGEENRGVWVTAAAAVAAGQFELVAAVGEYLRADVEGLDIARMKAHGQETDWLVVSSQGNDSFSVYKAEPPFDYLGRFRIGSNLQAGVDGVSDTDGLEVSSLNFGDAFPGGILVAQDGHNRMPDEPQNFKLVDWRDIVEVIQRQMAVD